MIYKLNNMEAHMLLLLAFIYIHSYCPKDLRAMTLHQIFFVRIQQKSRYLKKDNQK